MNKGQLALIKKDIRGITSNKRVFSVILIVPLVLTIVVPSILIFITALVPTATSDFQALLDMMPVSVQETNHVQLILGLVFNKIMPAFFMIIPIMASSVMAASSFVGEKEKHTLETLLYSPLSLKQLFHSKILACFSIGMLVSFLSFASMMIVLEIELLLLTGSMIIPDISWLIVMLLIAPAISLIAIGVTVRSSAKAQTTEEAQQLAVFLIFPILALIIGQFTGVIMVSASLLLGMSIVLVLLAVLLMRSSVGNFTYEKLLR